MKRITIITVVIVALGIFFPIQALAGSILPGVPDETTQSEFSTFYGSHDTTQMWTSTVIDMSATPGTVLKGFSNVTGLVPETVYFWGRVLGRADRLFGPEDSDDFVLGTSFALDINSRDDVDFYLANEEVKFGTIRLAKNYTGGGVRFLIKDSVVDVAGWTDFNESTRATVATEINFLDTLTLRPTLWAMMEENLRPMYWWRCELGTQVTSDTSIVLFIEDSTVTTPVYMVGFCYKM